MTTSTEPPQQNGPTVEQRLQQTTLLLGETTLELRIAKEAASHAYQQLQQAQQRIAELEKRE